jgi:catechol 2,3-dioxygenase-like lactoylglutathione lyase family enzyme
MTTLGLNHYNLRANRELLDALRDFYCTVVGLTQGERPPFSSFGYWLYAGDRDVLHLTEVRPGESRIIHASTTFDHVAFTCANRAEVEARLRALGVRFSIDRVPSRPGQVQLFFDDPAGNGIELNFRGESN